MNACVFIDDSAIQHTIWCFNPSGPQKEVVLPVLPGAARRCQGPEDQRIWVQTFFYFPPPLPTTKLPSSLFSSLLLLPYLFSLLFSGKEEEEEERKDGNYSIFCGTRTIFLPWFCPGNYQSSPVPEGRTGLSTGRDQVIEYLLFVENHFCKNVNGLQKSGVVWSEFPSFRKRHHTGPGPPRRFADPRDASPPLGGISPGGDPEGGSLPDGRPVPEKDNPRARERTGVACQ